MVQSGGTADTIREAGPIILGWKEYLDLPELGLRRLKVKIDTGARTSTLHVASFRILAEQEGGTADLELSLPYDRRHPERSTTARATMLRLVTVTDSGGHPEVRPLIATEMVLGPVRKPIFLTLTDRSAMLFRMILGRKALEGDFLVDVAQKYTQRRFHPPPSGGRSRRRPGGRA
ncbi:MAG TPA: RimK/LysX family protein [Thermoanaerobaculia bacterium]|nr:RimK/LysX family protein [Thermoanaerobaculia bacterium]